MQHAPTTTTLKEILPLWNIIQKIYRSEYNFELGYLQIKVSNVPINVHGKPSQEISKEAFGGCYTHKGIIYINSHFHLAVKFYTNKTDLQTYNTELRRVIAHELAHAVYQEIATAKFKADLLREARTENFTSDYLAQVPTFHPKYEEELFCEYLAYKVVTRLSSIESNKFADMVAFAYRLSRLDYGFYCVSEDRKISLEEMKSPDFKHPGTENCRLIYPDELFKFGYGTCWERALAMYDYLVKANIEAKGIFHEASIKGSNETTTHTSVLANLDDMWYYIEPTWTKFPLVSMLHTDLAKACATLKKMYVDAIKPEKLVTFNPDSDFAGCLRLPRDSTLMDVYLHLKG